MPYYVSEGGKKYHILKSCPPTRRSGVKLMEVTQDELRVLGYQLRDICKFCEKSVKMGLHINENTGIIEEINKYNKKSWSGW